MTPDRIKLSHEFPGLWLSVEIPVGPGENVIEEFKKGKDWLLTAYRELSGGNYADIPGHPMSATQVEKLGGKDDLFAHIASCRDAKVLETYKLLVKNSQELQSAYDKKFAELTG